MEMERHWKTQHPIHPSDFASDGPLRVVDREEFEYEPECDSGERQIEV
jgi:hypothetical protein